MNRRVSRGKQHQENGGAKTLKIKGVYVVRLLVCLLLGLNALLIYGIFYSSNGLPGYTNKNEQVAELEGKILKLKQENQRLFEMIQALKTDPRSLEKLVRQELGWVRENEVILEFPENENDTRKKNTPGKPPVPAKR